MGAPTAAAPKAAGQSAAFPARLIVGIQAGGWPPLEVLDGNALTGFSADYLRLLVGPGVELSPRIYPDMAALLAGACAGEVDVLMSLARVPQRERCLTFTTPYLNGTSAFVTRAGNEAVATLSGRVASARIAVEKGYALGPMLHERFPQADIVSYVSTTDALHAVVVGAADVYAGFAPVVRYQLSLDAFRDLRIAYEERTRARELRFAVPVTKAALRDQLNVALGGVRPGTASALRARWLEGMSEPPPPAFALSDEERAWLRALPPLKVGFDADWPPFSFIGPSRRPEGIASDYLDYLSRTLGVAFETVPASNWESAVESFRRGDLALLATSVRDDVLTPNAVFTPAYEHYPLAMVGRRDEPMARGIEDFAGRRIVLAPHAPSAQQFAAALRGAQPVRAPNLPAGLWMVAHNQADMLIANAAVLDMALKQQNPGGLRVLGAAGMDDATGFAVHGDLAPLAGLIGRALLAMPSAERQQIRNRWVASGPEPRGGWSVNALRLLPVVIVFGVVLLVTLRAYILLQREMRRRLRAEQVLARQAELQYTMMEMIPYPLGTRDLENRYLAVNRAYEEATGLTRAQVLGRSGTAIMPWGEDNSRRVDNLYRRTVTEGDSQRVELVFDGPDGESRHGLFWTRLCRDGHGTPFCVLGTMIDITEIRRAELRARETERLLSDVTRSLPAIVFQLRRSIQGEYTFPYLGGDTQRLLGDDGTALMSARELDVLRVYRGDRARLIARLERSARLLTPVHSEFRFFGAAGLLWVRAEFVPHREDDGAVVWSGYAVDASAEHARADELERARDMAEAASRTKDNFLAMMSHEIRTPMNGVLGLVEVLERTPLNADQTQMVGMVHESAGALLQILDDLLDYSKIQAGRLAIESEPFDVRELVDNAVGLLAGRAHEKGLDVRIDVEPEVAATLRGDSVRLRQILFNLLSNAIKFTPRGEVSVQVGSRDIDADADAPARQRLSLTVADTGIGIAPDVQARLFEPFVQAESSTTRRFGGTGLGLTICRRLAALMGGELQLQSTPGEGTRMTLHIELPVAARTGLADALRGKRALVACENDRAAAVLMHFGAALGMAMTHVTGADAVDCPVDVDLVFASQTLAARLPATTAPTILLTGHPKPTGYRVAESGVRLSLNPVSWRGLSAACAIALAGLPAAGARPAGEPELAPAMALAVPERERERAAGRLILVAEDHPVNQELIRHQLALLGFACDVVNDGAEALAALEHGGYGCLITDCHMPNVSGYDLTRRVRRHERRRNGVGHPARLPIIGITANTAPEELRRCREAGMDDCLVKPTRLATLREHLARWLGTDGLHRAAHEEAAAGPANVRGFEPLDLGHMIQVWGSEATVKALLGSFVSAVRDDLEALPPLLDDVDIKRLREWHHRLAGAVGVLQYPALLTVLETYRRHMNSHETEALRKEGFELIRTCHAMLDGVEQQAALLA